MSSELILQQEWDSLPQTRCLWEASNLALLYVCIYGPEGTEDNSPAFLYGAL